MDDKLMMKAGLRLTIGRGMQTRFGMSRASRHHVIVK
jgi:hypothetical protein